MASLSSGRAFAYSTTIFFVLFVATTGRDFGPMLRVEREAQSQTGGASSDERSGRAVFAWFPLLVLIGSAIGAPHFDGLSKLIAEASGPQNFTLTDIFGAADGYQAMLTASLLAVSTAALLALAGAGVPLKQVIGAALDGMGKMVGALAVLVLAWSLASAIDELQAGPYLKELIDGSIPVVLFPTLVFVVSAATAFATGTSFGTMGILVPTVVFLSFSMSNDRCSHWRREWAVFSVAVYHCSPISDTTVLSSGLGTDATTSEHVRTRCSRRSVHALSGARKSTSDVGALGVGVHCAWNRHLLARCARFRQRGRPRFSTAASHLSQPVWKKKNCGHH